MKLSQQNYFGLDYTSGENLCLINLVREGLINHQAAIPDSEVSNNFIEWIDHVTDLRKYPVYVFSKAAREMYQCIKIDDRMDFNIFKNLTIRPVTYCLDQKKFARFFIDDDNWLLGIIVAHRPEHRDVLVKPIWVEMIPQDILRSEDPSDEELRELIRAIIYVELTSPKMVMLDSGNSSGSQLRKVTNATKRNFTLVDKSWNETVISIHETLVQGHVRRIRVGKGRTEIREVYINPFKRKGFIRIANGAK